MGGSTLVSKVTIYLAAAFLLTGLQTGASFAAENIRLRDGLTFVRDLNQGFPILGDRMDDVALASGHPTLVFFGASGDLNTNRQAKRLVDLYKKYHPANVKFIVIDVDKPGGLPAKQLIKSHYQGYIPGAVLFDASGKSVWSKAGEVETGTIGNEIDKLVDKPGVAKEPETGTSSGAGLPAESATASAKKIEK